MDKASIKYKKRMVGYIKEPHTTIFTSQTGSDKMHLVLELIEKEYKNILTTSLSSASRSEKILPIMLGSGSKTTIIFG